MGTIERRVPQDRQGRFRTGVFERYATAAEKQKLAAVQADLGRAEADFAVLIPIRKSAAWWALAQDERRAIAEVPPGRT